MTSNFQQVTLTSSCHGKARVRVAKVVRHKGGIDEILEFSVTLQLVGGTDKSFLEGDNSGVVSTDTCRNHVYLHAKETQFFSCEEFAIGLAHRILSEYNHVDRIEISVTEKPWRRAIVEGVNHHHGFIDSLAGGKRGCDLAASRESISLTSILSDLSVLKTTKSGWENYVLDRFTTLPETNERILATKIRAKWTYEQRSLERLNFALVHDQVKHALILSFFGKPRKGVYSPGVQHTLYSMGSAALQAVPHISAISLSLPNLHFLPCNLPVFVKNGLKFEHDVYIPTDEPHGVITATVSRDLRSKL